MMIDIKKFNDDGIIAFKKFLKDNRSSYDISGVPLHFPDFHNEKNLINDIGKSIQINPSETFADKYEMGVYLNSILKFSEFKNDHTVWNWLSSLFYNEITKGKPNDIEQYILEPSVSGYFKLAYRHRIFMSVQLVSEYEDDWCKFILKDAQPSIHGDRIEQLCGNRYNLYNKKIRRILMDIYQDEKTLLPKRGIFNKEIKDDDKGSVRRFNSTIRNRMRKYYDIFDMSTKDFINVSGKELKTSKWIK